MLTHYQPTVLVLGQFLLPAYTRVTNFSRIFGRGNGDRLIREYIRYSFLSMFLIYWSWNITTLIITRVPLMFLPSTCQLCCMKQILFLVILSLSVRAKTEELLVRNWCNVISRCVIVIAESDQILKILKIIQRHLEIFCYLLCVYMTDSSWHLYAMLPLIFDVGVFIAQWINTTVGVIHC